MKTREETTAWRGRVVVSRRSIRVLSEGVHPSRKTVEAELGSGARRGPAVRRRVSRSERSRGGERDRAETRARARQARAGLQTYPRITAHALTSTIRKHMLIRHGLASR